MSETMSEVWVLVNKSGRAGHGDYEEFYTLLQQRSYDLSSFPSAFTSKKDAETFITNNNLFGVIALRMPIATTQQASVSTKDIKPSTVALQKQVAELDPTKEVLCQVCAEDGSAWSCYYNFHPSDEKVPSFHILRIHHPELQTLKGLDPSKKD